MAFLEAFATNPAPIPLQGGGFFNPAPGFKPSIKGGLARYFQNNPNESGGINSQQAASFMGNAGNGTWLGQQPVGIGWGGGRNLSSGGQDFLTNRYQTNMS